MSNFWQDIVKIVIDKVLLGFIALAFGFYLSRKLEDYRLRRARELSVVGRHLDAIRDAMEIASSQHTHLKSMAGLVRKRVAQGTPLSEHEMEPAYRFSKEYDIFAGKLRALTPFLLSDVVEALNKYLDVYVKVRSVVTEQDGATIPSDSELDNSFGLFAFACSSRIASLRDSA